MKLNNFFFISKVKIGGISLYNFKKLKFEVKFETIFRNVIERNIYVHWICEY